MQIYNFKGFLNYEIINKPFFGSRKRAKSILNNSSIKAITIYSFLEYLQQNYPKVMPYIEYIRFYNFNYIDRSGEFQYNLAMIYTVPDARIREQLFLESEKITYKTGWYPYLTGSRAQIKYLNYIKMRNKYNIKRIKQIKFSFGNPQKIIDISKSSTASATLLQCYNGNILFDTGFGIIESYIKKIDLICISHFHKDHTGGIIQILHKKSIPILISETTLEYLLNLNEISNQDKILILKNSITLEEIKYYKNLRCHIDYFPVFHAPGSYGFVYKFYEKYAILYFGDICIRNGFYNSFNEITMQIDSITADKKTIIFDAAMIGKKNNEISDDTPNDVLTLLETSMNKRNSIFISQSTETLLYSYLKVFVWSNKFKNDKLKIVVNDDLYKLIKVLWRPLIYHDNYKDRFVDHVLKNGRLNFAESYRLYPLSKISTFNENDNAVYFITMSDIKNKTNNFLSLLKADVMLVGPWTLKTDIPEEIIKEKPRSILRIASSDWSFHSDEQSLIQMSNYLCNEENNMDLILFHNYSSVIKKFIKKNLDSKNVHCSTNKGIILNRE